MGEIANKHHELAYRIWRDNGQNLIDTVKVLNRDHDYEITRQSLAKWRDKWDWPGRAARTEMAEKERSDSTSDGAILDSLLKRKERYEDYFEKLPVGKVDNQAVYGYNSILKTILDIKTKIENRRKAGETSRCSDEIRVIKTAEDAVLALKEAIQKKLNVMLSDPDSVSPKTVNDLMKSLDNVEQMIARYNPEEKEEKSQGLSDEAASAIRQKILGIVQ